MIIKLPGYSDKFSMALLNFIVALASGLILWYGIQRETKIVSIVLDSCVPVVSLDKNTIQGLVVQYNNKPINSIYDVEILVSNEGNSPIKKDDFFEALKIKFNGEIAEKMVVSEKHPPQIALHIMKVAGNCIEIEPLLLNQNDSFKIKMKVINLAHNNNRFDVEGRIVGVNNISATDKSVKVSSATRVFAPLFSGRIGVSILIVLSIVAAIGIYNITYFIIERFRLYYCRTKRDRIH